MSERCVQVIVSGRVQGVYFRAFTREEAESLGLSGWVRNRADGTVEALIQGEPQAVERMLAWFHTGSPHSQVDGVRVTEKEVRDERVSFEIRYR
ncbi:MAG: acylphosphatase [Desulfobacterales bacterium]|nr:acylphosphatase [Desulfobacterales bacterium]